MEEIEIGPGSPWLQRCVGDVEKEFSGRLLVVALLRKEGGTDMNPSPSETAGQRRCSGGNEARRTNPSSER